MKGSYILVIKNNKDQNIKIGKLGNIFFKNGFYVYIGSALNGLKQRIERHLRDDKKLYWHVDYLLKKSKINSVLYKKNTTREECKIASFFKQKLEIIPGFGCSDCKCKSHLFYGDYKEIEKISRELNLLIYSKY